MRPLTALVLLLLPLTACENLRDSLKGTRIDHDCVMNDSQAIAAIEHIKAAKAAATGKWKPDAEAKAQIAILSIRIAVCTTKG